MQDLGELHVSGTSKGMLPVWCIAAIAGEINASLLSRILNMGIFNLRNDTHLQLTMIIITRMGPHQYRTPSDSFGAREKTTRLYMYACICNAFTDKLVDEAIDQGARTVGQVFRHADCKPQCGRCVEFLKEDIAERMRARGIDPADRPRRPVPAGDLAGILATPLDRLRRLSPRKEEETRSAPATVKP